MFLAISGSSLYIIYVIVIFVIAFIGFKSFVKKNNAAKKNSDEKMGELNAFILAYEASKKAEAEKNKEENIEESEASDSSDDNTLDTATVVRINALYHDAEMSVEEISEKTGVSIEQIKQVIGND